MLSDLMELWHVRDTGGPALSMSRRSGFSNLTDMVNRKQVALRIFFNYLMFFFFFFVSI